jgi:hypothetical protein
MNNDDLQPGFGNTGNRQMGPSKYPEKMPNYSPSTTFNYGQQGGYNGMQQHPRRRADRFKRESINLNDKVVKQNDLIIRLLKEIRDRLPPPVYQEHPGVQAADNASGVQNTAQDAPVSEISDDQTDQTNDFQ